MKLVIYERLDIDAGDNREVLKPVDFGTFDGYAIGERILEGVYIKVSVIKNKIVCDWLEVDEYIKCIPKKKWMRNAVSYIKECGSDGFGEDDRYVIYDSENLEGNPVIVDK